MIRVYKYGLLPPIQNADLVRDQLRLAGRYRNTLVEIERARRAALRPVLSAHGDMPALQAAVAAAQAELNAALAAIRAERAHSRSSRLGATVAMGTRPPEDREARARKAKAARECLRHAKQELNQARQAQKTDPEILATQDQIHASALRLVKGAREICGVYWGTYLLIEDAAGKSFETTPMWDGAEPSDPRFVRFAGEGSVGVQVQGGRPIGQMLRECQGGNMSPVAMGTRPPEDREEPSGNTLLYIERVPDRFERARSAYAILHMRVQSTEKGQPVWAAWPMKYHRDIPTGSIVKRAAVSVFRTGPRERWTVQITLQIPEVKHTPKSAHRVAADIGWRAMPDGSVRVCYFRGTDGYVHDMRLPARLISAFERPDGLRRVRDQNFNRMRRQLVTFLAERPGQTNTPAWLNQATETLPYWRSQARLAALTLRWRDNRFPGDEAAYDALKAWLYHDRHLWQYECDERAKFLGQRKQVYRDMARQLACRFGTLVLEKFNICDVAQVPQADSDEANIAAARANRQRVAVSELRQALVHAFGPTRSLKVAAENTTHICHACGSLEEFDAIVELEHECSACGLTWDQDDNATYILLDRSERPRDADNPAGARSLGTHGNIESRWQRAARQAKERRARNEQRSQSRS